MDRFDPHGDDEHQHGTTGRDVCIIMVVCGLIALVLSTLDRVPV